MTLGTRDELKNVVSTFVHHVAIDSEGRKGEKRMKISELLMAKASWDVKSIGPDTPVCETASKLLEYQVGALVVTDTNKMVGIISERDLVQIVANPDPKAAEVPVSELMTRSVITCGPDDEVSFVLHQMTEHAIRHMPVLETGELVGVLSIRELTKAYELLQIEANTDPLTQVSNRRPFLNKLDEEFERAVRFEHPISVAMIDIDHFKSVNDTYGHSGGDTALRDFSALLISEFRTIDLVGRLGGEEFAVLFPETDLEGAKIACERLQKNIRALKVKVGNEVSIKITASIGLSAACKGTLDGPAMLRRADELLYQAKSNGRDCTVIDKNSTRETSALTS